MATKAAATSAGTFRSRIGGRRVRARETRDVRQRTTRQRGTLLARPPSFLNAAMSPPLTVAVTVDQPPLAGDLLQHPREARPKPLTCAEGFFSVPTTASSGRRQTTRPASSSVLQQGLAASPPVKTWNRIRPSRYPVGTGERHAGRSGRVGGGGPQRDDAICLVSLSTFCVLSSRGATQNGPLRSEPFLLRSHQHGETR